MDLTLIGAQGAPYNTWTYSTNIYRSNHGLVNRPAQWEKEQEKKG